jgi:hypothetical protein
MIRFRLPQKRELLDVLDERSVAAGLHPRTGRVQASPISPPVIESEVFGPVKTHGASQAESIVVVGELLAMPLNGEAAPGDYPDAA